ncbi:glucose/arabinose dehydrogenase [Spiribacter vilamensis]|uniref:Glucose/arabinose dehydrogenase n=2 Tax=Spiribacter vilamensis TaxID=531306 RepID=A0A4Q8D001_9GAMM|nr:glucose/arabinose dehydrogenase [Spiribacter vilamensis]
MIVVFEHLFHYLIVLLAGLTATTAMADSGVETLAKDLEHPWGMAFLAEGEVLVTERPGRLLYLDLETGQRAQVSGVPAVDAQGQGGLLDIELHPDFSDNRQVYLTWAGACGDGNATHLGRGRLTDDNQLADFETLFVATPCVESTKHFGSRISFDGAGHVLFTTGDRGERDRAQDLEDHNGAVIRLHDDGSIPATNPFVGQANAEAAIYSYGHRNPQGAARHPETGALWIHEHGPRGGDEINLPAAGENFGWPETTYGREYWGPEIAPSEKPGTIQPIHVWTPSIAPSGMAFHNGDLYVGALAKVHLARLRLDGQEVVSEERLLEDRGWRIRAVESGPDGNLYLLTDQANGRLVRVNP